MYIGDGEGGDEAAVTRLGPPPRCCCAWLQVFRLY